MISIDRLAHASALRRFHPVRKVLFAVLGLAACLIADWVPFSVAMVVGMGLTTTAAGRVPIRYYLGLLAVPVSFLVLGLLTLAIEFAPGNHGLLFGLSLGGVWVGVAQQGLIQAAQLFFRAMGAVSCLYFLSLSTPMVDTLSVLRAWKVPRLLLELMALIYRFIFVLLETSQTIFHAQTARLGYDRLSTSYRSLGVLVTALFVRSYKRSDALYTALASRGYEGELAVLSETPPARLADYLVPITVMVIIGAVAVAGRILVGDAV